MQSPKEIELLRKTGKGTFIEIYDFQMTQLVILLDASWYSNPTSEHIMNMNIFLCQLCGQGSLIVLSNAYQL